MRGAVDEYHAVFALVIHIGEFFAAVVEHKTTAEETNRQKIKNVKSSVCSGQNPCFSGMLGCCHLPNIWPKRGKKS